jgi:hypothetical protein
MFDPAEVFLQRLSLPQILDGIVKHSQLPVWYQQVHGAVAGLAKWHCLRVPAAFFPRGEVVPRYFPDLPAAQRAFLLFHLFPSHD